MPRLAAAALLLVGCAASPPPEPPPTPQQYEPAFTNKPVTRAKPTAAPTVEATPPPPPPAPPPPPPPPPPPVAKVDAGPPAPSEPPLVAGTCEDVLPTAVTRIAAAPDAAVARAVIPSLDTKRMAKVEWRGKDPLVRSCRGGEAPAGWNLESDDHVGRVEIDRKDLSETRQLVWVITQGLSLVWAGTQVAQLRHAGFLALVRVEGRRVIAEAVGTFDKQPIDQKSVRAERLGGEGVYVTPTGQGQQGEAGEQVWLVRGTALKSAGDYVLKSTMHPDAVHTLHTTAQAFFENTRVRLHRSITLSGGGQSSTHEEDFIYAFEGDRLVEKGITNPPRPR